MPSDPVQLRSERHGRERALGLPDFANLIWQRLARLRTRDQLFIEAFVGYSTPDGGYFGPVIENPEEYLTMRLNISGLSTFLLNSDRAAPQARRDMDLLFDIVELLYGEIVSAPILSSDGGGGSQITGFDKEAGKALFRNSINEVLALNDPPWELLAIGHVVERDDADRDLYVKRLPDDTEAEVRSPVEAAVSQFLRRGATIEDKRSAVKQLADALEHLRPEVKDKLLSQDERDLFRIANEFAIRHNNPKQRRDYEKELWLRWLFHVYLASIHLVVALRDRQQDAEG